MLPNRNNALSSNSNITLSSNSKQRIVIQSIGHASPPGMAHTADATTSCVALDCVGTRSKRPVLQGLLELHLRLTAWRARCGRCRARRLPCFNN